MINFFLIHITLLLINSLEINLITSLYIDQSNTKSSLNTQIEIKIRQLAWVLIRIKSESARILSKNQDLITKSCQNQN